MSDAEHEDSEMETGSDLHFGDRELKLAKGNNKLHNIKTRLYNLLEQTLVQVLLKQQNVPDPGLVPLNP